MDVSQIPLGSVTWPQVAMVLVTLLALNVVPQVLGYLKTRAQSKTLATIEHEVVPNHGSSMADSVNRIEATLNEHIAAAAEKEASVDAAIGALHEKLDRPFWKR